MAITAGSVFESTISKLIVTAITAGGSAVLGWLKKKGWPWATPIMYGIAVFGLAIFGLIGLQIWLTPSPKAPEPITADNIEAHLRDWLDSFGLRIQRQQAPDAAVFFLFTATLSDGNSVDIARLHARPGYIELQGRVEITGEHVPIVAGFTDDQAIRLLDEVNLELARAKVGFSVIPRQYTPQRSRLGSVMIMKAIPITETLNGDLISEALDGIDSGMVLAREALRLSIDSIHGRIVTPQ